jgi:hypothetical protein
MAWFIDLAVLAVCAAALWGLFSLLSRILTWADDRWAERLRETDPERYANYIMLREARKGH